MKSTASVVILILLLISMVIGAKLGGLAEVNAQETQPQIMSFTEAIEAAKTGNYTGHSFTSGFNLTIESNGDLFEDEDFSGFLMWLAPNGTFYKAEYPTGIVLDEIGHTLGEPDLNPPDGYYLWKLNYEDGREYWVLANNGTLFFYSARFYDPPPRNGVMPPPTSPPPFFVPQEMLFFGIATLLWVVVGVILIFYLRKRKE